MLEIIEMFDNGILNFIRQYIVNDVLDVIMPFITKLGDAGIIWIVITIVMLVFPKYRKWGVSMAVALFLSLVIGNLTLKPLIERLRPFEVNEGIKLIIDAPHGFSFPSGHSMTSFAGATVIMYAHKKWGIAAIILASLIAFSRLYLYVHYPTDVLVGVIMGIAIAMIAVRIVGYKRRRR